MDRELVAASEEIAVEELEREVGGSERGVTPTLDVTAAVGREGNVDGGVETANGGGVDDEGPRNILPEVVAGDEAFGEVREGKPFLFGEVGLLEADDVTFRNEVREGVEDKAPTLEANGVGGVVG